MHVLPGVHQNFFGAGVSPPVTLTYVSSNSSTTHTTTHTFASQSIGAQQAGRYIVVAVYSPDMTNGSVTVGGASASKIVYNGFQSLWWVSYDNANTTADIVLNCTDTSERAGIIVWQMYNGGVINVVDTGTDSWSDSNYSASATIDTEADGAAVAIASGFMYNSTTTFAPKTGLVERAEFLVEYNISLPYYMWGADDTKTDGTSTSYGCDTSGQLQNGRFLVASFR